MTTHTSADHLTLVLGSNGKIGRRVAERLRASGRPVRPGSRSANPRFDWQDRASWPAALAGTKRAFVSFQPDLAAPWALETVTAFFAQAAASGVERLVLLSGRGEAEAEQAEQALQASGAEWTILRCSWFCQNFSESFLLGSVCAGEVALPVGDVAEPFVDAEDIADVAVAALTDARHAGELYELTGPRALSFAEAVAAIGHATGQAVRFASIPPATMRDALLAAGVPAPEVDLVLYLFETVLDGRNERVTDGVQRALGRAPRSFDDYARRTAATGAWGA